MEAEIYSKTNCGYCDRAKLRLAKYNPRDHHETIKLDQSLQKNYIDCIFYSHTIKNTADEIKRATTYDRYDIAKIKVENATQALESHIFR